MRGPLHPRLLSPVLLLAAAASPLGCDMDYGELFGENAGGGAGYGGGSSLCVGCSAPMICHATYGCVECESEADCSDPSASHCVNYQCVACERNSDCDSGSRCHPSIHRCAPTCDVASDCEGIGMGVATLCSENNLCVQCESAADCTTPLCHPERGLCVECVSAGDCPGDRPLCRPWDGACVQCLVSTDCGGAPCVANTCQAG